MRFLFVVLSVSSFFLYPNSEGYFTQAVPVDNSALVCGKGEYVQSKGSSNRALCVPCNPGSFMPLDRHSYRDCKPCSKVERFNMEIELQACTAMSDVVVGCLPGYTLEKYETFPLETRECVPSP